MYTCTLGWIRMILTFLGNFCCLSYRFWTSEPAERDGSRQPTRPPFIINVHLVAWNWSCQIRIGIPWQPSCEREALEAHMTEMNLISSPPASSGACLPRPSQAATFCSSYWVTWHPTCSANMLPIALVQNQVFTSKSKAWPFMAFTSCFLKFIMFDGDDSKIGKFTSVKLLK